MNLSSLHLLLTYQCTLECDHCFVWGSPWQTGTLTLENFQRILRQAQELGTIESIYFEGGEPFLYYALLLRAAQMAAGVGFKVGVVSNGYWATTVEDAVEWLKPFADLLQDLSVSSDVYHWNEALGRRAQHAQAAATQLGIPLGFISIAQPGVEQAGSVVGQLPAGESSVMFRGRAAQKLAPRAPRQPWPDFAECPYEDLREPGRVHVDPLGNLHICQGIVLGNVFEAPLKTLCAGVDADAHPITGPLLKGGPAELARRYSVPVQEGYADACHLCYDTRCRLRSRFPDILQPDQMYGAVG